MVNISLVTKVAEEFGFDTQEANELCTLLSEIPTQKKSELDEIRESLKMLNDGIEKIQTALKRVKAADKAMYSRLTARDDSGDTKYHKDIMQHSELGELHFLGLGWLKNEYHIERNKKPKSEVYHKSMIWRKDPEQPNGVTGYGVFAKYSTRKDAIIETLTLIEFWLKKGRDIPKMNENHPFFVFSSKIILNDYDTHNRRKPLDCYINHIKVVPHSEITDELLNQYSWNTK